MQIYMGSIVRTRMIEYMKQKEISIYRFSKQSGIPESTIRCIIKKEDYEVREKNILRICKGMNISPYEMFCTSDEEIVVLTQNEIPIMRRYRELEESGKYRVEGYMDALLETGKTN